LILDSRDTPRDIGFGDTKRKIMELLLDKPASAADLAEKLKIQKSAARVHLESLQAEYIVKSRFKTERFGRPSKVYELTEHGREIFPRKYDVILNYVLKQIAAKHGEDHARNIIESVADVLAADIRERMEKSGSAGNIRDSLKILNSVSNELGFASALTEGTGDNPAIGLHNKEEEDNLHAYSIVSKNCILHRVALENQDAICHGLHDTIIKKSLENKSSKVHVELKECMALGNTYCRHVITDRSSTNKKND
jgi:predicted ArsR family transcriptional regulator